VITRASLVVLVLVGSFVACRSTDSGAPLQEIAKARSGTIDVVLLSREAAVKQGKDTLTLEFRRASDGSLVDVGAVKAGATMPMAGMAPMVGTIEIEPGDAPGRYTAASSLTMAGEWRWSVEWNGPAGSGSATFSPMVQ
jgi:hypothetical protein